MRPGRDTARAPSCGRVLFERGWRNASTLPTANAAHKGFPHSRRPESSHFHTSASTSRCATILSCARVWKGNIPDSVLPTATVPTALLTVRMVSVTPLNAPAPELAGFRQ
eukprot:661626-Rhodomonas_salina.1